MAEVRYYSNVFAIKSEFFEKERIKQAPQRAWDKEAAVWLLPPTRPNAHFIRREFDPGEITESALSELQKLIDVPEADRFPQSHEFKLPPMQHQSTGLDRAWGLKSFAFFFAMRLGKTYTAINLACARYGENQIHGMVVICPTPIKSVWESEIKKFTTVETHVQVVEAGVRLTQWDPNKMWVLVVGVEALSQGGAYKTVIDFIKLCGRVMGVVDESSRIKNHKSVRTERCINVGGMCDYRIILTGTPTTQGIHDLYTQFEYLDKGIIGQKSFWTFRNRYMIMGGYEGKQIMGYRNTKELMDLIAPYSMVVKTGDVYDMKEVPPQVRNIKPSAEQKRCFQELKHLMSVTIEDDTLEAKTMLERMTRFQQINGGFFPYPDGKDNKGKTIWKSRPMKSNPKLEELENMLDEFGACKVIIWARFIPEIEAIRDMLIKNGKSCVTFYGNTSPEERVFNVKKFQEGDTQFFVGNQSVGGMGIKLSIADVMVYYSNTFSYEDREQSKARSQEVGKQTACQNIDLVLDTTIDRSIMASQAKKGGMAEYVESNLKELNKELY